MSQFSISADLLFTIGFPEGTKLRTPHPEPPRLRGGGGSWVTAYPDPTRRVTAILPTLGERHREQWPGKAGAGLTRLERLLSAPQIPLWGRRRYWRAQAMAFGIPADGRDLFVDSATRVAPETNRRTYREVAGGCLPTGPLEYSGPMVAIAGEREQRSVKDAFPALRQESPQLHTWVAPGMHHPWNIEDADLFTAVIRNFVKTGRWPPAEQRPY